MRIKCVKAFNEGRLNFAEGYITEVADSIGQWLIESWPGSIVVAPELEAVIVTEPEEKQAIPMVDKQQRGGKRK